MGEGVFGKEYGMDMNERLNSNTVSAGTLPIRAGRKHVAMFVVACVLLAGILLFLSLPTGMEAPEVSDGPVDPYVAVGGLVYMIGRYLIAAFLVFVGVLTAWIVGLVLAVKLARRRAALPKGLWVASLALVGAYLAFLVVLVAVSLV
jgi:hypothetical protein